MAVTRPGSFRAKSTDEGNPEKYINTQLMVLTRDTGEWRIRTISWSTNQP